MTISILKNTATIGVMNYYNTNVYRDNSGNAGWNNSKMIVTADYHDVNWQSMLYFFIMIGI